MFILKKENFILNIYKNVVQKANLSKDEELEITKNAELLFSESLHLLKKLSIQDNRFGPAIFESNFIIPDRYFFSNTEESQGLIKGKEYRIKIFPINSKVSPEDCIVFLSKEKNIFTGQEGKHLLFNLFRKEIPIDINIVSFGKFNPYYGESIKKSYQYLFYDKINSNGQHVSGPANFKTLNGYSSVRGLLCICEI